MTEISFILNNEVLQFDPDRIGALECEIGPEATEDMIFEATEALVRHLETARKAYEADAHIEVIRVAREIAQVSENVGMITIARVARDVIYCCEKGDVAAFHATYARLFRVGEGSVTGAFDYSDQYI